MSDLGARLTANQSRAQGVSARHPWTRAASGRHAGEI